MLDPKFVGDNIEAVQRAMANRGLSVTTEQSQLCNRWLSNFSLSLLAARLGRPVVHPGLGPG